MNNKKNDDNKAYFKIVRKLKSATSQFDTIFFL